MNKKRLMIIMLLGIMVFYMVGCTKKEVTPENNKVNTQNEWKKVSLPEIRKQAENQKTSYKNLDLSKTKIIIPEVDEVYDMTFPISTDSFERQVEKFQENIRKYEGLEEDVDLTQYMSVMYWDVEKNDRLTIPFNKATEQQKKEIQYLGYNDGKCSECIVFSNFMLEMGDHSVLKKVIGDSMEYSDKAYGYEGHDLGTLVKRYDLSKDDISGISYPLVDGEVILSDAIAYVEKHMKEDYYFVGSKLLDYHVFAVEVRQLTEDVYEYEFDVSTSYQGLTLNKDDSMEVVPETELENREPLEPEIFATNHLVTMLQKNRLGYIWSCCQHFESVNINDTYQDLLTVEDACSLLSDYIAEDKKFQIGSIELIYQTAFEYENKEKKDKGYIQSVHANPVYHFSLFKTGFSEFGNLYFDVDAVSGEITTMNN
ncbi:MAG: hypothetical protein K1V96_05240 [Lachnospiraceae bacterium]